MFVKLICYIICEEMHKPTFITFIPYKEAATCFELWKFSLQRKPQVSLAGEASQRAPVDAGRHRRNRCPGRQFDCRIWSRSVSSMASANREQGPRVEYW